MSDIPIKQDFNILELAQGLDLAASSSLMSREQASYSWKHYLRSVGLLDEKPKKVEDVKKS